MIKLTDLEFVTMSVSMRLDKEQERLLAGDIENFLMQQKSVLCKVEVT